MSQSTSSMEQKKTSPSTEKFSRFDAVALVVNTALKVRDGGHEIVVRHAKVAGEAGILVFLPGFELTDGNLKLIQEEPETA
ncbi:MAG: hypothetical protein BWY09_01453 [Candidatus Hydrogenedentes bacterium ADurb.Bin179]|jgi:hypothetical protein|nr:MAG: hypothetical protein BWY09_01453 [Candidatus Hydrogenedentes bacterium ADurb.Bin179]